MLLQCLAAIIFITLIVDQWRPRKYVKLHRQLGNDWTHWPIIGNMMNFIGNNEDRMTMFKQMTLQAYKRQHQAVSSWLCNKFFVGIVDADQASVVLKSALDKNNMYKFTKHLSGNGSVFAPVEIWHPRRKILVPTFAHRHISKFVTVFEAHSNFVVERLESRVGKGNFSCFDYISPYALDSVCETLFGLNLDLQNQPKHPFFNAFTECFKNIASRFCQPWLYVDFLYELLPVYAKQERMTKIIHEFVDNLIRRKRALIVENDRNIEGPNNSVDKSKVNFKSFLELMIEKSKNTNKGYTHEELREETIILALAGTDTSAVGICFTVLLLSQHTDVQDKVYREIQEVCQNLDKPLQLHDLVKLKYTKAVIKEALRLYPPVPFVTRCCRKDLKLPSGLVLPKGCNVIISIWGIHRNPRHWGEDADDFNPDRFMSGQNTTTNAFMAFSYGSRNCVGQQYAMLSITTTLVTILRRYRLIPATNFKYSNKDPLRLSFDFMMKHVDNFSVQVEHRNKL